MINNNIKLLYVYFGTLEKLIETYETEANVESTELKYIKTYCKKASEYMINKNKITIGDDLEKKAIKKIKDKFNVESIRTDNLTPIWVTGYDLQMLTHINIVAMLIEEGLEKIKVLDPQIKTYARYVKTWSYKFFKLVEETADEVA